MTLDEYLQRLAKLQAVYRCSRHDARVCVNPTWHMRYWLRGKGRWMCSACLKLNEWIAS